MKNFSAIVIDDEPPARDVILEYLEDVDWVEVQQSFSNPREALSYLNNHSVDLLFLDIQMPQMNGFELVSQLEDIPKIIFSTAYDEYAIRAFDINAVDYLLKPYTKERFLEALRRVQNMATADGSQQERIQALLRQVQQKKDYPSQLFVRSRNRIVPVEVENILWIEAEGDYSQIYLGDKKLFCGLGIGKLLERLDPENFVRVHRSHAISLSALRDLSPDGYGGFTATLQDNTELKVSRTYADTIKDHII